MAFLFCTLFYMLGWSQHPAEAEKEPVLFVRTIVEKPTLSRGDSTLVSIVLYSDGAFIEAKKTGGKELEGKGIRKLNSRRTLGTGIWQGRRYNTLVWAQYMVASEKECTVKTPKQKFSATLRYTLVRQSPFGYMYRNQYKDVSAKCKSDPASITFTEKPKQTTKSLISTSPNAI